MGFFRRNPCRLDRLRCLEREGTFSEGAAVAGRRRLVDPPLSPFCFSFEHVFAIGPAFYFISRLFTISCGCYINIGGRKAILKSLNRASPRQGGP
jgi:hypothetical protein